MKQIKNVAVVEKYFYPVAAGIETNILETYSVLVRDFGWNVSIHTSKDTLTEKNVLKDLDEHRGIKVFRQPFRWYGYFPKIDYQKVDAVCLHNFNVAPHFFIMLYTLFLKLIGKKNYVLILTPHGGFNPEWRIFPSWIAFVKKLYHFTFGTFLINLSVDGMRAVSEWEKEEIIKKGVSPKIVRTISNGLEDEAYVDVDQEASADIKNKVELFGRYIIQIGRIYMIKNYETTLKALTKTPADVKYVIAGPVGDEKYFSKLKKMIADLNLSDRVVFIGVVRGVDKYFLIKHAQMMVHMALWESFCNVVHEGMSQGLVCIVANNTALPLLIKDRVNGFCVETMDHEEAASKINYVLDNQDSQDVLQMKNVNKKIGSEMSWRKVAAKMNDFYIAVQK